MGTVLVNTPVYAGPSNSGTYAQVGTLFAQDTYETIWDEYGYQYIEYPVTGGYKRGYIPGGSNVVPDGFELGLRATMKQVETVWSKPGTGRVSMGSVSAGETVSVLYRSSPYYAYIEYGSSSGTKRGWVSSVVTDITFDFNTALAKMRIDTNTYSDRNTLQTKVGALGSEEFVVVLAENSICAQVEYCITSSPYRKQAYISKNTYTRINATADVPAIPLPEGAGIDATMSLTTNVYGGPDDTAYASIGSVSAGEAISVIFAEFDWFCIDYSTSSGTKRGYVLKSKVSRASEIMTQVNNRTNSDQRAGWCDRVTEKVTAYTGPSTSYATAGMIGQDETVTRFIENKDRFILVEYYTSNGAKRGYISRDVLANLYLGEIGYVSANESATVSYLPDLTYTAGAVGRHEYVVILSKDNISYFIEYNTNSGRKRGFVNRSLFAVTGDINSVPEHQIESSLTKYPAQGLTVYGGPGDKYAEIGLVFKNEAITALYSDSDYSYIQYTAGSGPKRGYILSGMLSNELVSGDKEINLFTKSDYPNLTDVIRYGYSGCDEPLLAYQLGTGKNHLILNFAIHGWEDVFDNSGWDIERVGEETLKYLHQHIDLINNYNWTVYIILSSNPDGLRLGYTHNGPGRCTMKRYGSTRAELVDGGVDMNRSFDAGWERKYNLRNYTGPEPCWCPEAEHLRAFIDEHKSNTGYNIFIDTHGYTTQIISNPSGGTLDKIFHEIFGDCSPGYSDYNTGGGGYVTTYAYEIRQMESCLFEFPKTAVISETTWNVSKEGGIAESGIDKLYINAIVNILTSDQYSG